MIGNEAAKMSADLDDLNRTLYDIGAQDLLDVWEAMEAQVRTIVSTFIKPLKRYHVIGCFQKNKVVFVYKKQKKLMHADL
jgi:hypothetical protein